MDISKLIAEAMCVAAAVVASATLPMSAAATDMAYGDVAEPSRKDARQQEIKEWFLENYFGRAPVGRLQTVPRFLQNGDGAEMTAKKGVLGAERWEKHFCTLLTVKCEIVYNVRRSRPSAWSASSLAMVRFPTQLRTNY